MDITISNRQIVEELKGGNPIGCTHLVAIYQNRLFDHLVGTFHIPRVNAEELVDDVLLAVVRQIGMFSFRSGDLDFARWVFTICRNTVRDYFRHAMRTDLLYERYDESDAGEFQDPVWTEIARHSVREFLNDQENSEERAAEVARPLEIITMVLQSMESWERVLLRCRALNIPYEEIAHYVEKPAKQLKIYHLRVRRKFMKLVEQECRKAGIGLPHRDGAGIGIPDRPGVKIRETVLDS